MWYFSLFAILTQPNDDVYVIFQLDTIEQYKRHHPMLGKQFQGIIVMTVLNRLVHQNNWTQKESNRLRLEFVPRLVEKSNYR